MMEYPKALYMRGWLDLTACVTVDDARGEASARADGYRDLAEPEPEVIPVPVVHSAMRIVPEVIPVVEPEPKPEPPKPVPVFEPAMRLVPEPDDEVPARLRGRPRKAN